VVKIMGLTVPMEAHVKSGDFGKLFGEDLATRKSTPRLKKAVLGTITNRVIQDRNPLYKNGPSVNGDRDYVITEISDKYKLSDVTPDCHEKLFLFFDAQNWKPISELTQSADLGGGKVLEIAAFESNEDEEDIEPGIVVDDVYPSPAKKAKKTQKAR